jgi:hypothetical protein
MKKLLNILIATDYSGTVRSAELYAIQFAKETGSSIKFIHV